MGHVKVPKRERLNLDNEMSVCKQITTVIIDLPYSMIITILVKKLKEEFQIPIKHILDY